LYLSNDFENIAMGSFCSGGGRGAMRQGQFWDLDIAVLKRLDMLRAGHQNSLVWSRNGKEVARISVECLGDHLILNYRSRDRGGEWEPIRDHIPLSFTTPNYGGKRAWFICPNCGKRKRVLWGRKLYRCAKCYGMTHNSQYEDRASRLLDRAQKIKVKLGGDASCMELFPPKPKGMHWRTYEVQRNDYERLYSAANEATLMQFGQYLL
tara:strand:+ start:435 stop:1058 length:624 start_codon:yes stop_codon:yes gene_type:complete